MIRSFLFASILLATPALAFVSPEHKEAGDQGFAGAVAEYQRTENADPLAHLSGVRKDGQIFTGVGPDYKSLVGWFGFGELVAIYGDMRATVEELNSADSAPHVPGLKNVAATGDYAHNKPERDRMMELAFVNETHFSGKALAAYVKWHDLALTTALRRDRHWLALHYEALGLHSLTDLFAPGHMLVDREQTMTLLQKAGAVARAAHDELHQGMKKLLHAEWDYFRAKKDALKAELVYGFFANLYHNGFNFHGATVSNLRGESWRAFGDHRLHHSENGQDLTAAQRAQLKSAVSTSVLQVLRVANHQPPPLPGHRFAALQYLPIRYRNAATCQDLSKEKLPAVAAVFKQGRGLAKAGGLDAGLLLAKPIPDGDVAYLDEVRRHCDKACAGQ